MPHNSLQKFRQLGPADWGDLLRAQVALVYAQVLVWTRPQGRLVSASTSGATQASGAHHTRARQLGHAVRRASRYGVLRPSCLVRSVALIHLLKRSGIQDGSLRIGVQPRNGKLLAHAWVEYGGQVLGDRPDHVRGFQPVVDLEVLTGPRSQ